MISQRKYILDLLKEIRMSGCRPANTLIDPNQKLCDEKKDNTINTNSISKKDIVFVISLVSRVMHSPSKMHLEAGIQLKILYLVWGNLVIWRSKKQARNSAKVEYKHYSNPVQHNHTNHMEIDKHFMKDNIECEVICLPFVPFV
ncbi:hypothetical protein CR513_00900, partial [Mucuna pruriens]